MSDSNVPAHPASAVPVTKSPTRDTPRRAWLRNNVEAFTVAIVMALVIKQFFFEAFQVPTESMEPTIIGRTPGGDRIIVCKFAYELKDPRRYDVVVFRYPLSRVLNYVKRLVGLPGEKIVIASGDIWAAKDHDSPVAVTRKPRAVQDVIFRANPIIPKEETKDLQLITFRKNWDLPDAGSRFTDEVLELTSQGQEVVVISKIPLTAERRDRYAEGRQGISDAIDPPPIGDLRVELEVEPSRGAQVIVLDIVDGPAGGQHIRLEVAVSGSGQKSKIWHGRTVLKEDLGVTLPLDEETEIVLENVDDRIRVEIGGDEVFTHDYVESLAERQATASRVTFGLRGGKARFSTVALYRDTYYTDAAVGHHYEFKVPEGHYFFLGDNSANSLDARAFRLAGIRLRKDGTILLGDLEAVADDFDAPRQRCNPYAPNKQEMEGSGQRGWKLESGSPTVHHFLDLHGNRWDLEPGSYDLLNLPAFGYPSGNPKILELHLRKLQDPTKEQVALAELGNDAMRLAFSRGGTFTGKLADEGGGLRPELEYSVLVHFVPREDIMGQAFLVFWPLLPGNFRGGPIR